MSATTHDRGDDVFASGDPSGDLPPPPALDALALPAVELAVAPLHPVQANPAARAFLGGAATGEQDDWSRRLFEGAHEDAASDSGSGGAGFAALAAEVARDGKPRTFEHRCETADGRSRWMSTLIQVGRRRDGRVLTLLALMMDVTESRQALESSRRTFSRETVEREHGARSLAVQQLVSRVLVEAPSVAEASPEVLRALGSLLDCPVVIYWAVADRGRALRCQHVWAADALARSELVERTRSGELRAGEDLAGRACAKGEPIWIDELAPATDVPAARLAVSAGLRTAAAFPIRAGDDVLGVIEIFARDSRQPDEDVLRLLASVGQQVGQALRREEGRRALQDLERALQAIPAGITVQDERGALVYANDLAARSCGFSSGVEMQAVPATQLLECFRVWDESGRPLADAELPSQLALSTGQEAERVVRFRVVGAEISDRWMSVRAIPVCDVAGRLFRVVNVFADITERRRVDRWQRFLSEAGVALVSSMDADLVLQALADLAVGSVAEGCAIDMYRPDGSSRRVAVARADGFDPEQARQVEELLRGTRATEEGEGRQARPRLFGATGVVARAVAGEGPPLTAPALSVPLTARGQIIGVLTLANLSGGPGYGEGDLMSAEDLARRVSITIDNARLHGETQESLRAREDLLAIVSHDLRNPLGVVLASSALLLKSSLPPEKEERARRQVEAIQRAGNRMNRLIRDLLDFASIQGGRLTITPRPHEVASLVAEVLTILEPLAVQKALRFENEMGDRPLCVSCDHDRLIQAFSNIVGNAIKFTPDGGDIRVSAVRDGAMVRFCVADTGPGIPADQVEHVFDRYFQAQRKNRDGIGLGLSIAKGIIDAHGGRIWVESEEGHGSRFFVALPAVD